MIAFSATDPATLVPLTSSPVTAPGAFTATTWYVSRNGNDADGRSWATAWNELGTINWAVVQPGDTILLDGGVDGMTYHSALTVGKSGAADAPITIRLSGESGRDGKVIIFGGRDTPLPYCDQSSYSFNYADARPYGITFPSSSSYVVVDGVKWRGIVIYGHNESGVRFYRGSQHHTLRNVEIYDNGKPFMHNGTWRSDQKGVDLSGANITVERAIIHDNGQDAFQSGGGVSSFTLRESWLYNSRTHPVATDKAFNYCSHSDGIQVFNGGNQRGLLIERSIIGPGFMQGVILGQTLNSAGQWATLHDVVIRDSLFYGASNANIMDHDDTGATNWLIERVTSVRLQGAKWHNVYYSGSGIVINNSVFVGGMSMSIAGSGMYSGNCQWQIENGAEIGAQTDPQIADIMNSDYALRDSSPCAGKGTSITSPLSLLSQGNQLDKPVPSLRFFPQIFGQEFR